MKFFNKDGKWNWVDENNVFVGYEHQTADAKLSDGLSWIRSNA